MRLRPSGRIGILALGALAAFGWFSLAEAQAEAQKPRPNAWTPTDSLTPATTAGFKSAPPVTAKPSAPPSSEIAMPAKAKSPDSTGPARLLRADTVEVVRHHYSHREQIIASGAIMAALIASVAIMNNYNPR